MVGKLKFTVCFITFSVYFWDVYSCLTTTINFKQNNKYYQLETCFARKHHCYRDLWLKDIRQIYSTLKHGPLNYFTRVTGHL